MGQVSTIDSMRVRILAVALAAGLLVPSGGAVAQRAGSGLLYPDLGNAGYDVKHYDIELSWFAGTDSIDARTTITARATTTLDDFSLDLRGLTVSSVKVAGTECRLHPSRSQARRHTRRRRSPSGQTFTTVVKYAGKPQVLNDPDGSQDGWLNKDVGRHRPRRAAGRDDVVPQQQHAVRQGDCSTWRSRSPAGTKR